MAEASYRPHNTAKFWWCNSHQREATHILTFRDGREKHCCSPDLGGIMLPCRCVDLSDIAVMDCA